ncbi:MAG: hypothetical protein JWM44_3107 [Bacilli bacterium]|nr:hypothetical protein [Bacilli bacterium]
MKSRKYPSFNEAITYLKSKGDLKYWGWEGQTEGYYVYSYVTHKGVKWHIDIYKNGLIKYREW